MFTCLLFTGSHAPFFSFVHLPPWASTLPAEPSNTGIRSSALLRAARHRPFRQLWAGSIIAGFAQWMNRLAIGWFVLDQTGSALLTTIAHTVQSAPGLLVAPFGGAIADRVQRKLLLALTATVECVVGAGLAFVAVDGIESVWPVVLLVGLTGSVNSLKTPATQTLIPDTVGPGEAMNGIAIYSVGIRGVGVAGALSGGILLEIYGPVTVFATASALFGIAVVAFVRVDVQPKPIDPKTPRTTVIQDTLEGLRVLTRLPTIRALLVLALLVEILCFSFRSILPVVARNRLDLDESGLGALTAMGGFGSLLGAITLVALSDYAHRGRLLILIAGLYGLSVLSLGASNIVWLSFAAITCVGLTAAIFDALQWGLLQENVPDEMRGRAVGGWVFAVGFGWIGHLTLGAVSDAYGVQWALGINGGLAALVAIVFFVTGRSLKDA